MVKAFCEFDADLVNHVTVKRETALMAAIRHEEIDIVEYLVGEFPESVHWNLDGFGPLALIEERIKNNDGGRGINKGMLGILKG